MHQVLLSLFVIVKKIEFPLCGCSLYYYTHQQVVSPLILQENAPLSQSHVFCL